MTRTIQHRPSRIRRLRAIACGAWMGLLGACAVAPPFEVDTPVGAVRAQDEGTARRMAQALEAHSRRLDRLEPAGATPPLEVWVVDDPGRGTEGVMGSASHTIWSRRWIVRVNAGDGYALLGHELFHARFHPFLEDWPLSLEEGLADRFGPPEDLLGDGVRIGMLLVVARHAPPKVRLHFESDDRTLMGEFISFDDASCSGPPPMEMQRALMMTRSERDGLSYPERLYTYGVGYCLLLRWLGPEVGTRLPAPPSAWTELLPASQDELTAWAADQIDDRSLRRWAFSNLAAPMVQILAESEEPFESVDDCLARMSFLLRLDGSPSEPLRDDPDFRELLELIWPQIAPPTVPRP